MNLQTPSFNRFLMPQFRSITLLFSLFALTALLSACLNEDNKIPENCYDGILNNGEELVDCGGSICPPCDPCENGQYDVLLGEQWVDCGGECDPCDPSFNGQLDPGEDGIDCGGSTGVACGELCDDGLLNGYEAAVDCGDGCEDACPTCCDGIMNGDEVAVDCGGNYLNGLFVACNDGTPLDQCPTCPPGVNCGNGLLDGDEQYIDCGGDFCPECMAMMTWKVNGTAMIAEGPLVVGTMTGGSIGILGTPLSGGEMGLFLAEPALGWQNGITIQCNPTSMPTAAAYTDVTGTSYATSFGGGVTVDITYVDTNPGGIIVGTFMGTVVAGTGASVNLAQGTFMIPLP